eukprot:gene6046-6659_t
MEDANWEPLPPRKKIKSTSEGDKPSIGSGGLDGGEPAGSMSSAELASESIARNIAERQSHNRSHTTLQSKDGCAGEFYEYLDHTADVQCHAWGKDMIEAFENMAECMLNYMTDINLIALDPEETQEMTVSGHDMESLLYNYMNELLFRFITDSYCAVKVKITKFDREGFSLSATLQGDIFDLSKHSSGTEIKAITYSAMQIHEKPDRVDLFVIVDI